jgi:acyl-CoA thioester hydrolase
MHAAIPGGPELPQSPLAPPPRFFWPVRVYYEDTDSAGIVYCANYLRYLERARTEWLRALGFEQTDIAAQHGVVFVVRSLQIEYLAPARFNDGLNVSVELVEAGASQIVMQQRVLRENDTLVQARVRLACVSHCVDSSTYHRTIKPVRIPGAIKAKISEK